MRHPKQNEYERNARNRHAMLMQATMLGWEAVDILSAFHTPDGDLVVIDKDLKRYATTAEAEQLVNPEAAPTAPVVSPADVPVAEFGPRWQSHLKILHRQSADGGILDLMAGRELKDYEKALTQEAGSVLRAVEIIRSLKGPDWREQIGLDSLKDSE